MADEDVDDADDAADGEEGSGEGEGKSGGSKKKLFIIIGAAALVVLGGGAAAFFTGLLDPLIGGKSEQAQTGGDSAAPTSPDKVVFHDLPEMIVTLNTGARKSAFLKIRVALELTQSADIPKVQAVMPRIVDNFQVYLRELRVEDLKGSAGMYRLREELLTRVKAAAHPTRVNAVLFKEMLIQ
jgi:flagellar protein FliL